MCSEKFRHDYKLGSTRTTSRKTQLSSPSEPLPSVGELSIPDPARAHNTSRASGSFMVVVYSNPASNKQSSSRDSCSISFAHRCRGNQLGSPRRRLYSVRQVESQTVELAWQLQRNVCDHIGGQEVQTYNQRESRSHSIGQSNSCRLPYIQNEGEGHDQNHPWS